MVCEKEPISKLDMVTGYAVSNLGVKFGWVTAQEFIYRSQCGGPFEASPCDACVCVCVCIYVAYVFSSFTKCPGK